MELTMEQVASGDMGVLVEKAYNMNFKERLTLAQRLEVEISGIQIARATFEKELHYKVDVSLDSSPLDLGYLSTISIESKLKCFIEVLKRLNSKCGTGENLDQE